MALDEALLESLSAGVSEKMNGHMAGDQKVKIGIK